MYLQLGCKENALYLTPKKNKSIMKSQTNGRGCAACDAGPDHDRHSQSYWMPVASAVLFAAGLVMQYTGVEFFASSAVRFCWYLAAYFPVGLPVLREAWNGMRQRDFFTEYTLMSLAAIGAFYIGEYPEGVAVMLFYSIGEALQERAVERARRNIRALVDIRPEQANVLEDGKPVAMPAAQVVPGRTIEVLPGGRVPLDGVLLSEAAPFNTAALTGESTPRTICKGDEVLAGMISSQHPVRIEVTRPYGESALSRILSMVEEAAARKAPAELFIRRFARIYTPVVTGLAVLIVALPGLWSLLHGGFAYSFDEWLSRALVFLVASCPCALVISIPLGYFSGIGVASKAGVLFKGGSYLDAIARVNTVVFDKTGTLTEGLFEVREVHVAPGVNSGELLGWVASAERTSTHPVARAVVQYAEREGVALLASEGAAEIAGHGIRAEFDGKQLLVGNTRLMARFGVEYPSEVDAIPETIVVCALDGRYAGYLVIADKPKEDAARAVAELKSLGIEDIRILSGDREALVANLGRRLGVSEARGDLLPEGKMEIQRRSGSRDERCRGGDGGFGQRRSHRNGRRGDPVRPAFASACGDPYRTSYAPHRAAEYPAGDRGEGRRADVGRTRHRNHVGSGFRRCRRHSACGSECREGFQSSFLMRILHL